MALDSSKICFGLSDETDKDSFVIFLQLAGRKIFAETLAQRLSSEEICKLTDDFMVLIRKHFDEKEYHEIFLNDPNHHHKG